MEIRKTTFAPKTYLVWRKEINIKDIMDQSMWQTAFGKVHDYIQEHELKIASPGSALYFSMDPATGTTDFGIGNAAEGATEISDAELTLVPVAESKAIVATVHGAYDRFPGYHMELQTYLKEHGLRSSLTIEEYVVTGMDKPDPNDWETNIYYLYT